MIATSQQPTHHQPIKVAPKRWQILCTWDCGKVITSARKPPAMLGCSSTECNAAHNAHVTWQHEQRAARPRAPRQQRQIPASDWNMLVAFSRKG